ncbi:hypothetical protein KY284_030091 [Solanum tuberosum]|nr:hypothetical protein KY284_030091 [Solanum tuberosum]
MVVSLPIWSWFKLELGAHLAVGFRPKNADLVILKGKGDGDWFDLGLVWSCFRRSFLFRGGVFGCCHFWVISGGGFGQRRCGGRRGSFSVEIWLKLLAVFGVGSCWFSVVVVGSSENMEMGSFPVALEKAFGFFG